MLCNRGTLIWLRGYILRAITPIYLVIGAYLTIGGIRHSSRYTLQYIGGIPCNRGYTSK